MIIFCITFFLRNCLYYILFLWPLFYRSVEQPSVINIFWFRRDLRLFDNHGLFRAMKEAGNVLPLFIFDTNILKQLENPRDARVGFIYREVEHLKRELEKMHSTLLVYHGKPEDVFRQLFGLYRIGILFFNRDYEPYARKRDEKISLFLKGKGVQVRSFKDQVIFEPGEIIKTDGKPYVVYTPYMKKWMERLAETGTEYYPSEKYLKRLACHRPAGMPSLGEMGFTAVSGDFPSREPGESLIRQYHVYRDYPAMEGTSRLSIHFRFGTVSIRQWVERAVAWNGKFLEELIWREFYQMILWHFPRVADCAFKPAYDMIPWRNDEREFDAWCRGVTGYPLVDAGMRQLLATGYMHNRVRMITAGFLTKLLLIDWRWGEAWFAGHLMDYELSSNNGGWQWAAGSGCDAAPWFRIFNPFLQQKKYDSGNGYVKKWIPEFGTKSYPVPLVDYREARERAVRIYRQALSERKG